jgi:outer membrane lipoprotein-sorting protein
MQPLQNRQALLLLLDMKRSRTLLIAVGLALAGLVPLTLPVASYGQDLTSPQAIAERASAAINQITTLKARFLQVDPYGNEARGDVWLERPGRVRFEYDAPAPTLIIADGATVAHIDLELETADRAPIRRTPLHPLLKADVNLVRDLSLSDAMIEGGLAMITARDDAGEMDGAVTLVFDAATYDLVGWSVEDALGQITRVRLENVEKGTPIAPAQFIIREPRRR